ncbi:MAG: JAB domain-containing protein [Elusimicrobiota bacterium]
MTNERPSFGYWPELSPAARKSKAVAALVLQRLRARNNPRPVVIDCPSRALGQIPAAIKESRRENFFALYLNTRNHLLHSEIVSIGTLSASLVHPREVFAPAIFHCAAALIVAHNHPSGDCAPSTEDKDATRRLENAGALLGIPLLDHIIVSSNGDFYSFRERGEVRPPGA